MKLSFFRVFTFFSITIKIYKCGDYFFGFCREFLWCVWKCFRNNPEFLDIILDKAATENLMLQVTSIWLPGHSGIEGNEIVDAEAKKAVTNSIPPRTFNHRPLKAAQVQSIKAAAKAQWLEKWDNNIKTSHFLRCIMQKLGVKARVKLYSAILNRKAVAAITKLVIPFQSDEFIKCEYGKKTVEHYMLECQSYAEQRKVLQKVWHRKNYDSRSL